MTTNNEGEGFSALDLGTSYKIVITWIKPFDGTKRRYMRFSNDCDRCFASIKKVRYGDLINFVLSQLDEEEFMVIVDTKFETWEELKKALDEHFGIRLTAKNLFKELMDMQKNPGDTLYKYYNRLIAKCFEYKKFMNSTFGDQKAMVDERVALAEEYALETFLDAINVTLRLHVREKIPKTIQEAYKVLRELEIANNLSGEDSFDAKVSDAMERIKSIELASSSLNFCNPHVYRVNSNETPEYRVKCQLCGQIGHIAPQCSILHDALEKTADQNERVNNGFNGGNSSNNHFENPGNNWNSGNGNVNHGFNTNTNNFLNPFPYEHNYQHRFSPNYRQQSYPNQQYYDQNDDVNPF